MWELEVTVTVNGLLYTTELELSLIPKVIVVDPASSPVTLNVTEPDTLSPVDAELLSVTEHEHILSSPIVALMLYT